MKKFSILAAIIGLAILPLAHATTVGFTPGPTSPILRDSKGVNLFTTSLVWGGNFTGEGFSLNQALTIQQNVNAIIVAGGWEQFGFDTASVIPTTSNGGTGALAPTNLAGNPRLGGSITDNSAGSTKADYFNGRSVYVWVFNASTVAAATEMGIFKNTGSTPWVFPTNAGGLGDSASFSAVSGATIVEVGGVAGVGAVGSTPTGFLQTTPVPEPSTVLLTVLGLVGMTSRRRRNVK